MDPRAILTIKSQTNKAVHITQFLTEKNQTPPSEQTEGFVLKSGNANSETLVLKADEEHPYLGIYMEEWGAANMRQLNHLLSSKKLRREDIEFYLAYTTKIYELAEKYKWNSVLNYDYAYRELQAKHQFQWGTFSPSMELQLLAPKRNQTPKSTQQPPTKNEDCKIFKAKGSCPFDTACKYRQPKKNNQLNQPVILLDQKHLKRSAALNYEAWEKELPVDYKDREYLLSGIKDGLLSPECYITISFVVHTMMQQDLDIQNVYPSRLFFFKVLLIYL